MSTWQNAPARYKGTAALDGVAFLSYYCPLRLLSFNWDGSSEAIEVSHDGFGEPVRWLVPAPPVGREQSAVLLFAFTEHCKELCAAWDLEVNSDEEYWCIDDVPYESHCSVPYEQLQPLTTPTKD